MTSHAAVVARGMGKCCVRCQCHQCELQERDGVGDQKALYIKEGDYISLNGSTGQVYAGEIPTKAAELSGDFKALMDLL